MPSSQSANVLIPYGLIRAGLALLLLLSVVWPASVVFSGSGKVPDVAHPIVTPHVYTKHGRCENCGMKLNMWARTRYSFDLLSREHHVCSIQCVAVVARQSQEAPQNVKVAVYLEPETMIAADQAFYLVGSTARGTMSAVSKIAFASKEKAENFGAEYGGTVMTFTQVLAKVEAEL
ncbi:MAG: nitrous oxide reductase accessory protein NosL [Proteobacteria bacterium]|nr:nitrous oxide reductase accessory protein NosL [Pseudomonadota bacterium]MBU1714891.1 nitrous oxide reductase accessory protein NosL [Pseudomonadota bacterium]